MFIKTKYLALASMFATLIVLPPGTKVLAQDADPPGRIARINLMEGSVSFQPAGEGDWLTAVPNRPLTTGDNLWTDRGSRDELHVGSTVLRMGPETSLSFLDLDDRATQMRLAQGSLIIRVHHLDDDDDYEIDTPNLAFAIRRPGEYRLDVSPDGDVTTITAWHGQGEAIGGGYTYEVVAGQRARFTGTDELNHDIEGLGGRDPFDRWALDRDDREDHFASQNYVSEEMTGYEDLDGYGRWNYVAGYGNVWVPTSVPSGWAPYRYGHWAWVAPWGWTWVEDEPWGFAPFHYGRWASGPGGWFWVPGPVVTRPVYAPALVAFVGGGALTIGGGPAVAWFPLAPGEVFVPGYHVSERYVTQVNVTNTVVNVTRVTNVYRTYVNSPNETHITYVNQRVNNAVTVVNRDTFINARPVVRNVVHVDANVIVNAPVSHEVVVRPERPSVLGTGIPSRAHPPAAIERRQVVASHAPAPPKPEFGSRPLPPTRVEQGSPAPAAEQHPAPPVEQRQERPAPPAAVEAHNMPGSVQPNRPATPPVEQYHESQGNRPPEPQVNSQPQTQAYRPAPVTNEARPTPPQERPERNVPRPPQQAENAREQQQWSHPLAKPAPPVKEQSPQHAQQEEQKFHNWQQQQKPAPPPQQKAAARPEDKHNKQQ